MRYEKLEHLGELLEGSVNDLFHALFENVLTDIMNYAKEPDKARTITIKIKVASNDKREYAAYAIEGAVTPAKYRKLDGMLTLDIHDDGSIDAYEKRTDGQEPGQQLLEGGEIPDVAGVVQFPTERAQGNHK